MGLYQHIREAWKKPKENPLWQQRLIAFRAEPSCVRIEKPTRLDRARSLGYKAKQGFVIVRLRLLRGGHERPQIKGGRRSKRFGRRLDLRKNYQTVAEERVQKDYPNLTVLNSYYVGDDGKHCWYEVILIDYSHPVIIADKHLKGLVEKKSSHSRVFHGKTTSGRKGRGLI